MMLKESMGCIRFVLKRKVLKDDAHRISSVKISEDLLICRSQKGGEGFLEGRGLCCVKYFPTCMN